MQFDKAHLSQSNRFGACFFGQQGMPSAICMAFSPTDVMLALEGGIAAIRGAAGPITIPTAIPNAKNQRMRVVTFMAAKSHRLGGLRSPAIVTSNPISGLLHHALVRIRHDL